MKVTKQIAAAVFWVGLALSLMLSVGLLSALGGFGLRPSPVWVRLLIGFLILTPFAVLIVRAKNGSGRFDFAIGFTLAMIVIAYATVMLMMNE